jgi:FtsH-binding integral membrane protein
MFSCNACDTDKGKKSRTQSQRSMFDCGDVEGGQKMRTFANTNKMAYEKDWNSLTEQQEEAVKRLGWDANSWDARQEFPFQYKAWELLTKEQKEYLGVLGVDPLWWDGAWKRPWEQLNKKEQAAAQRLHFTREAWNENRQLQFQTMKWGRLTAEQRTALGVFKFDGPTWDDYIGGQATETDPLVKKKAAPKKGYEHGERVTDCPLWSPDEMLEIPTKQHFIEQAYGVVMCLLVLAFLVSFPVMRNPSGSLEFFSSHAWIIFIVIFIWVMQIFFFLAALAALKVYGDKIMLDGYIAVLGCQPWKCAIWAAVFTICSALLIACVLASFDFANICVVYLYTAFDILCLYLFIYCFKKKADFSTMYGYCVPIFGAFVMGLFTKLVMTDPTGLSLDRIIALCISVGFGWIVVFDTQIIFGERHDKGRKYPYFCDQWCLAGYEMYFDFIFFCFQSFKLIPGPATLNH